MHRSDAERFLDEARQRLDRATGDDLPADYVHCVEGHFHTLDWNLGAVGQWPCEMRLMPSRSIRQLAGPPSYDAYIYGLAEHNWLLKYVCGYRGDQHLLDVGCGFGKTAFALLRAIRPPGSYTGFDIDLKVVNFLQTFFQQRGIADHFHADYFPIQNRFYAHQNAAIPAEEFVFPYAANRFHCAVLHSIFTHLLSAAVVNYVNNLGRVVRPGGRILVSTFLLENAPPPGAWEASPRLRELQEPPDPRDRGCLRVRYPYEPEYMVAYRQGFLTSAFAQARCQLAAEPVWGSWSGRPDFHSFQDYLVFRKEEAGPRAAPGGGS
jgi:SAM-dependent methyltransferase